MNIETYILISAGTLFLLFVICFLLIFKKRRVRRILKNKILADGGSSYLDIAKNITMSMSKSKILYRNLIVKVHPDKFQNDKNKKANELASRITVAKRNYDKLCKLEIEVGAFLKK